MKKPITRRQAIEECVKSFIRNYPQEYQAIMLDIRKKRAKMPMSSHGEVVKENGKLDKDGNFAIGMRLPARMLGSINEILKMHNQAYLFQEEDAQEADKEYQWFKNKFPMFQVPEYRKRTFMINNIR